MKKVIAVLSLVMLSFMASAEEKEPQVKKIYDGWDIDKVYVLTDTQRGKWCYVISNTGRLGIQCFDIKEGE